MINGTVVDVQSISDGSGTCGYIAKGHITNEAFEAAIRQSGWSGADEFEIAGRLVDQTTMRCIPAPHIDEYDFTYEYSEPGRGAFKCTVVYL